MYRKAFSPVCSWTVLLVILGASALPVPGAAGRAFSPPVGARGPADHPALLPRPVTPVPEAPLDASVALTNTPGLPAGPILSLIHI